MTQQIKARYTVSNMLKLTDTIKVEITLKTVKGNEVKIITNKTAVLTEKMLSSETLRENTYVTIITPKRRYVIETESDLYLVNHLLDKPIKYLRNNKNSLTFYVDE